METVLYTAIIPAEGQSEIDVIRKAHVLGYELVKFAGWDDQDLSGLRKAEAKANQKKIIEIQNACEVVFEDATYSFPHILQVVPKKQIEMSENEALAVVRQYTK